MKVIINQNERGLVFCDGIYKKMLMPGKNKVRIFLGESFVRLPTNKAIVLPNTEIDLLISDKAFADSVIRILVPDGMIAVRFDEGRVVEALPSGKYFYFNVSNNISYTLFDLIDGEIIGLSPDQISRLAKEFYQAKIIPEGEIGLLYLNGKFSRTLESGTYYFWQGSTNVACDRLDMRRQQLEINSQEILTADKVSLRINFVCTYSIIDAVSLVTKVHVFREQIYTLIQLALRKHVANFRFDELLEQKENIAAEVLTKLKTEGAEIYIDFLSAGIKDIILPGEIRDIMNTVLVAEKNAQANVIARREEVASTRSLLNTAKLLEENTTLYKLKEMEYLERICDKVGSISVSGGNLLGELQKLLTLSPKA